jgi:hypothetical protein
VTRRRRSAAIGPVAAVTLVVLAAGLSPTPARSDGPLAAALDLPGGPELDRRRASAVALRTASCMTAAGHPFQPWVEPPPVIPDADLDPIAWAERWGFGISTADEPLPGPAIDPNLARIAALPTAQRLRATEDLFGSDARAGCQPLAADHVYGLRERVLLPLRPGLTALGARIEADPVVVAARAGWLDCVAPWIPPGAPGPSGAGDLEPVRAWFAWRAAIAVDADVRQAVELDERRVAAAFARCDVRLHEDRRRAASPHEQAFVSVHRVELDELAAIIRREEAGYPLVGP